METKKLQSMKKIIFSESGTRKFLLRNVAILFAFLILGIGQAWASFGGSSDYGSKLTVTGATGKGVVYADQVTNPSKVAYAYSSVLGPNKVTDNNADHTYYAWVKACRGWSFDGWTSSNTKSQTNSGSYYTVVVAPTKDGTKEASLTAKWKQQTAVKITYQVPKYGAYKVEYAYETYNEDSKSFVAANIASPNVTKNMNDASSAQTIDSYSGDIIKLTSTSGEFLGWYSSDDWADEHKLSDVNPYTYSAPASGSVSVYARYNHVETYYGKLNAVVGTGSILGGGKIFVSAEAADGDITYSDETQNATKSSFGLGSQIYYLYAQPTDKRYVLRGWYTNPECTTPASVTKVGDHYEYTLTASSINSGSPTEQTLYASFEYNLYFLQVDVAPATPGLGMVLASKTSLSPAPQYGAYANESSLFTYALRSTGSANVYLYARGKYGYKFSGWYSNPECTGAAVGTANPFTYAAPASSADPQNPTITTLYAKFVEDSKINVTYNNPDHTKGEYKAYALGIEEVDDEYVWTPTEIFTSKGKTANTVQSQYKTDVLILEAEPQSGYGVTSWTDGGTTKTTPSQRYETTAAAAKIVGVTFGEAMPFLVGADNSNTGTAYATLREALNNLGSNKKITVIQSAYVPAGEYTIPSGVTLLIPYDANYETMTAPTKTQGDGVTYATLSQYCRLTLDAEANITVNGAICIAGHQFGTTSGNPGAGYPCGAYGAIDMTQGGHITINNGANLYAYGFVFGGGDKPTTGTITIKNGGAVYEDLIINDMHGGGGTAACVNGTDANNDFGLFPFSQYFIQNVEPKMTIEYGGKEQVYFAIYSSFGDKQDKIDMIGNTNSCLFQMTSSGGSVTKWYDYARDYQCYEVTGDMQMNKISINVTSSISMSSEKFVLPINNNMEIRIKRNTTMTLPYDVKILPGAKLIIDEGATMNVQKELYVYDKQDWDKYACGAYAQTVTKIPGHTPRTVSSLDNFDNATIVVNGTLRLSSSAAFYTTSHGGSVISEGTGKIIFDVAGKSAGKNLYEVWGTYGKSSSGGAITAEQENPAVWPGQVQVGFYELVLVVRLKGPYYIFGTPVATTPAKLRNEDGSYVATAGAIKDDQFIYNKDMGQWLKNPKTVTWDAHGGEVEPATTAHSQDAFLGELPMTTREGYTFNGWFTTASGGTKITPATKVTANVTYHAQWTPNVYNITYMDQGKVAFSGMHVDSPNDHPMKHTYGTSTMLNGANGKTGYEFDGWHTISNCKAESKVTSLAADGYTKDITLYAKWVPQTYNIIYKDKGNADFSGVHGSDYPVSHTYGTSTTLVSPSKTGRDFDGWYTSSDCESGKVTSLAADGYTGDITLYAKWAGEETYTITWKNDDGEILTTTTCSPGDTPAYPTHLGTPISSKGSLLYEFIGWNPAVGGATGNAEYIAQYQPITNLVVNDDQTITIDATVTTTTVKVEGKLNVSSGKILTTDYLILEGSESASGEVIGNVETTNAYFDLSHTGGFKAKTWYAVAVPWQVDVPAYNKSGCGVYIKKGEGAFVQQELGRSFDLIYYDGARRAAEGHSDACWVYLEDKQDAEPANDAHRVMHPGKAYMIYLTSDADVIRFKKNNTALLTTQLGVEAHSSALGGKNAHWNGIANPATFHAYINVGANDVTGGENYGQIYNSEQKKYDLFNMSDHKLVVGQPIFVQTPTTKTEVTANANSYAAPRRAKAVDNVLNFEVNFATSGEEASDKIIIRTNESKEFDEYMVGQDLAKMGVSATVPQMWVNRYDSRLCINTVAPINNIAVYPLSLFAPQAGEYTIFVKEQMENDVMLYLTVDGRSVWNLTYAPYTATLEQGTTNRYGLKLVRNSNAPAVTTGIQDAQADAAAQKIVLDGQVYILRGNNVYSVDGRIVK